VGKSILVADDNAVTRNAIRDLLTDKLGNSVECAEAMGGEDAMAKAMASKPDVVVLDVAMPGMNGVEAGRKVSKLCPKTAVLIISNYDVAPFLADLKQAGIRGFVPKTSMGTELIPAIQALLEGNSYFGSEAKAAAAGSEDQALDHGKTDPV
jgi:two-component system, NarL family, response regulator NreC